MIPEINELIEWLPKNIPSDQETTIVHGDFRLDNMIFDPITHEVKAILDWELSTLGNPIADFTYHMMSWRLPAGAKGLGMMGSDLKSLNIPSESEYAEHIKLFRLYVTSILVFLECLLFFYQC